MKTLSLWIAGVVVVAAGFGAGAFVERASASESTVRGTTFAGVYDCPGGLRIDGYQPGSRVYVVGESANGHWAQIRDLDNPSTLVWIQTAALDIEDQDMDFPTASCETNGFEAVETTTTTVPQTTTTTAPTTTTTTAPTTTTTTTKPTTTTTTKPTTTTTTKPTTTTSTAPPDTTAPSLSGQTANPTEIYEYYAGLCTGLPRTSAISVTATDAGTGVTKVEASWTVNGSPTTIQLAKSGSTYSGTFPTSPNGFAYGTVPAASSPISVTISIAATDGAGNKTSISVKVFVHSADDCFG